MEDHKARHGRWRGRFYVRTLPAVGDAFVLSGDEGAHAAGSRRAAVGDRLILFDGSGSDLECTVTQVTRGRVSAVCETLRQVGPPLSVPVTCMTALPKGRRADRIVEQCAQLGVWRLVPVEFGRSIVRPAVSWPKSSMRFERLAVEAAKQSGSSTIMQIAAPMTLEDLVLQETAGLLLAGDPTARRGAVQVLDAGWPFEQLTYLVGPEGGLSTEEMELVARAGFQGVRLTATTLRVETACAAFAAVAAAFVCGRSP